MAAVGIFCAMVLDSLDGRVARMTNTQSAFGEQMDSLSDMVCFGAAPALIVYEWALKGLGKAGWIAAFVYCACAALRLARFNTNIGVVDKRFFQGMPSPAAAAWWRASSGWSTTMASRMWASPALTWTAFAFALYAGLTMVTNVPFYSFKDISLKRSVPFIVIVLIALGCGDHHPPAHRAVRAVLRVRRVRLRGLRLQAPEGQAGERDLHLQGRTRRARPALRRYTRSMNSIVMARALLLSLPLASLRAR
jgi:CDP-diacylglycerol--serine O-phosphatidyltransferase